MKKLFFILLLLGNLCYGQLEEISLSKNRTEIKLNALSVSLGTVDVEFERTLNENSSIGVSLFSKFEEDGTYTFVDYDGGISGFYRYFFSKKYARGFFLEGFSTFHNTRIKQDEIKNNLLIGLGIGYKHVFKNNIILQAHFGMGRNMFDTGQETINGKAGISIGYRF